MARRTAALRVVSKQESSALQRVETRAGASAAVEGDAIVVRDPKGGIVVIYDAVTGNATIAAPRGDLKLAAPKGKVVVSAATDLELTANGRTTLQSETLDISSQKASLRSKLAELVADTLEVTAPSAALGIGRWQLKAERVFEQASEVYREVHGVIDTRAGRIRSKVAGATQWFSKSTSIVSEEDTFVDGRRVLLG
jgi:hypothetical protein